MGGPSSLPAFFWVLNSDPHACRHFVPQVTFPDPLSLKRNPIKSIILPLLLPESLPHDFCLQLPLKDPRPPFQDTLIHGVLTPANLSSVHHPRSPFQPRSPTLPLLATEASLGYCSSLLPCWIFSLCSWTSSTSHKAIRRNLMLKSMTPGLSAWTLCSERDPPKPLSRSPTSNWLAPASHTAEPCSSLWSPTGPLQSLMVAHSSRQQSHHPPNPPPVTHTSH